MKSKLEEIIKYLLKENKVKLYEVAVYEYNCYWNNIFITIFQDSYNNRTIINYGMYKKTIPYDREIADLITKNKVDIEITEEKERELMIDFVMEESKQEIDNKIIELINKKDN